MTLGEHGVGDAVDMLAEAREAQWSALSFMGPDAIKLLAPAKVNLFLGVGEKRPDGYHDVNTVMHALALHDVLYMTCRPADDVSDDVDLPGSDEGRQSEQAVQAVASAGPEGCLSVFLDMTDKSGADIKPVDIRENLVFRAIDALACEAGRSQAECIKVRVEKHIPSQAGLGGGSSDAAAALLGAAHFWGIDASDVTVRRVAAQLGADVPFFLEGGCGFFTGRGDHFERKLDAMKLPLVIVRPSLGVSTPQAYAAFDKDPVLMPARAKAVVDNATGALEVPLFNNLAPAVDSIAPQLAEVRAWLCEQEGVLDVDVSSVSGDFGVAYPDAKQVLLSGSGSATFAVCGNYAAALRIVASAGKHGWWARATSFSSLRAAKVST